MCCKRNADGTARASATRLDCHTRWCTCMQDFGRSRLLHVQTGTCQPVGRDAIPDLVMAHWQAVLLHCVQVFVAGATGRTGRRVVQQLRAAGYKVRAGVRVRPCIRHEVGGSHPTQLHLENAGFAYTSAACDSKAAGQSGSSRSNTLRNSSAALLVLAGCAQGAVPWLCI
jgi:hypothetical protein